MKLTKKQAKELSIKKWEYIVGNDGIDLGLLRDCPELAELISLCGYCEKYLHCAECPIYLNKNENCMSSYHPYYVWHINPTKANAQKVLDLIRES